MAQRFLFSVFKGQKIKKTVCFFVFSFPSTVSQLARCLKTKVQTPYGLKNVKFTKPFS
jgi:hypothetical protein